MILQIDPVALGASDSAIFDTVPAAAADTTAAAAASVAQAAAQPEALSLWQLCVEGGWIMIILALLLVISVYVLIERAIVLHKASRRDEGFMKRIKDYIHDGEIESALNLCRSNASPYSRLIAKGITRIGRPMNDVLVAIENTGNLEVAALSKGLPWLATTAAGAPMLGFLGTVTGMVQSFYTIATAGNSAAIGDFAGGIYTALVTTVAGLIVGIAAMFAYNYLVARINKVMNMMEARTMEFMDLLNEPAAL
ncbi:MAG: MotA/TolQ/ExbB proton channel family protein [Muribaculaceae bacterium]|nr:MotA/TolQ/ExbB proton channel family protein [Muribaculaceae bacterium]